LHQNPRSGKLEVADVIGQYTWKIAKSRQELGKQHKEKNWLK
jgi:hypothetical protein